MLYGSVGRVGLRSSIAPFSPAALFAAGEVGGWYDPSDLTTLFQDAAGTTPVTAVEQPVGLVLDKSKGLVLGSELVTNGDFSNGSTGWTLQGGVSVSSGQVVFSGTVEGEGVFRGSIASANKMYRVSYTCTSFTSGVFAFYIGGVKGKERTSAGSFTEYIAVPSSSTNTNAGIFSTSVSTTAAFDNISVRELPGNHLSQSTSTARPVLSARVNLLTYTEQFDNAVWAKTRCTVTPNDQPAPDGTQTVDKFECNETASGGFYIWRTATPISVTANVSLTTSIVSKKGSRDQCALDFYNDTGGNNGARAFFNLATGAYISSTTFGSGVSIVGTPTITALGGGLYRMSMTVNSNTTVANPAFIPSITSSSNFSCTSGVDFGYAWGADLRVSNDGVGLPAYQRVTTSTDYDTTGFPLYLKFDGTDDFLVSGTIDPGSVDKAQVFAGVRKLSDSPNGMLAELSASFANPGTFALQAPWDNGPSYRFVSGGNGGIGVALPTDPFNAPVTNILTALGDISGDRATLRINGTQAAQATTDQGTGNYLAYPLYVGSRNGTIYPFKGHLYSLILRFSATNMDAATIASTETWVNSKTGAY